ncbi:sodium:proton antiporter NhaD [Flavobacteriaceae bacterium F89]|uniref:Sodium:proton antiporter NhaD n=1 Tax=Cerina litoralis TaxID=2874477 RepID=A0AAE3JPK9_9FLAO|nr:sodium:proton antiporter NhaD [Cerina litoralis]MCG2459238.1 sodium:proton antiporter NhaD [Cerina litoralis]
MYLTVFLVFIVGYLAIALEHQIKINKTASALLVGVLCWVFLIYGRATIFPDLSDEAAFSFVSESLVAHLGDISEVLFFLMGAMTIVELIDVHHGFSIITDRIKITSRVKLIWVLSLITFFLSAALDNLTTAIVMATLLRKLLKDPKDLWLFAGMVVIAANAGGAWSPIGDVTTIMLWVGGQITALNIIREVFLPSLVCLLVPLVTLSFQLKGNIESLVETDREQLDAEATPKSERNLVFGTGVGLLLFVPVFKAITHLPPFMGVLFGVGVVWVLTEILHRKKPESRRKSLSIVRVLQRIDTPSILFFLGILLAVSALEAGGHLLQLSTILDQSFDSIYVINAIIGVLSSIIDNVPLVAGAMGMYSMDTFPQDSNFWELLAYCAGTGGSILIIGSAAGVAIMGILRIDFIWYLKRISLLALLGYLGGIGMYMLLNY